MKNIFFVLILFSFQGWAWGQGNCNLTPNQTPSIRGFRLGMTLDQVFELVPDARNDKAIMEAINRVKAEKIPSQLTISFKGYELPYSAMPMFQNIHFLDARFFKNQLTNFYIQYNWPYWNNADAFIAKLRESIQLPEAKEWQGTDFAKSLRCKDFEVSVQTYPNAGAYISMTDTTIAKKMDDLRNAILEKARKEFKP
jgi:hypothetical protein